MTPLDQRTRQVVEMAAKLPPPQFTPDPVNPQRHAYTWDNAGLIKCACGKWQKAVEMPIRFTGVLNIVDNVCPQCAGQDKGMARIVCARCKQVVARMKPHRDQHGFTYREGVYYHVEECPGCVPETRQSMIVEKILFLRDKFGPGYKP